MKTFLLDLVFLTDQNMSKNFCVSLQVPFKAKSILSVSILLEIHNTHLSYRTSQIFFSALRDLSERYYLSGKHDDDNFFLISPQ